MIKEEVIQENLIKMLEELSVGIISGESKIANLAGISTLAFFARKVMSSEKCNEISMVLEDIKSQCLPSSDEVENLERIIHFL